MTLLTTLIAGTNDALALYVMTRDIQSPVERIFLDADLALSTFGSNDSYTNGNPAYANQRAGSNDSDKDNYIEGRGVDNLARVKFRYLLPIGNGENNVITTQIIDRGQLVEWAVGGDSWNLLESGRTYLEMRPFWRQQTIDSDYANVDRKTNGVDFAIYWENTDFPKNPSKGNTIRTRYTKDWGWFDSSNPYDVADVEFSKYFPLGSSDNFAQRVIALDFWTVNTLSWNDSDIEGGQVVFHRPPPYAGATLGGLWRLRGYPTSRFNDRAAIYYAAEFRMTPEWNPFAKIEWVRKYLEIAWWQVVPFVEVGRVAPSWEIDTLHSSIKWDVGIGIRAMAKGLVVRIDTAVSKDDYGVQMMVGHPFQF
ncbi:MAG: BamA/TamA family outer membrane protein [Syntrophales bacterium]